jgi:hypothetical protein
MGKTKPTRRGVKSTKPKAGSVTRRGLGDGFRVDSHGAAQLKTRSHAVEIYSVLPRR